MLIYFGTEPQYLIVAVVYTNINIHVSTAYNRKHLIYTNISVKESSIESLFLLKYTLLIINNMI